MSKLNKGLVAVSGGFDPLHIGHVRMIREARVLGDRLVVILNNDNWLRGKKGFIFMPQSERSEMLLAMGADEVFLTSHDENDDDRSVCDALRELCPEIFANGGDRRNIADIPEAVVCDDLGIRMEFGIGTGGKVQSSSWLTDAIRKSGVTTQRPWGSMTLYAHGTNFWLKTLTFKPGQRTSLQKHIGRGELWMCIDGQVEVEVGAIKKTLRPFEVTRFASGVIHRVGSGAGGTIIELAYGTCDEGDNIRLEDDYGRTG